MFTSGQFALLGNVGRKALRLYREEGLLVPAYTNDENGYHYYEESQLSVLETIKRLRSIGLSLFEIKRIIDGEVDEKTVISGRIKETDGLLNDMKEMLNDKQHCTGKIESSEPDIRPFPKTVCLYIDENVDLEKLGMSVGKLYEKASKAGIEVKGSHFIRYDGLNDEASFSMRTCLPITGYEREDTVVVSEDKCLHLNFKGGFSKVSEARKAIIEHATEHDIKLADRAYEVYNKDMSVDVYYVCD
jgi:DNA-binding transcriptional MerR regulator